MKKEFFFLPVAIFLMGAGCGQRENTLNINDLPPTLINPTATSTLLNIPTDWKEYTNAAEAYSLSYPPDFILKEKTEIIEEITSIGTSLLFPQTDLVKTIPEAKVNVSSQKSACKDLSKTGGVEKQPDVTMQDRKYSVYRWADGAAGSQYGGTMYQTEKDGRCYRVSFFTKTTTPENYASSEQEGITLKEEQEATLHGLQLIFETILSTFKV